MEDARIKYCYYKPGGVLRVTGEDAEDYLQSQCTNDVAKLGVGQWVYALFLDRKGKIVVDSFILKTAEEEYLLVSYFCDGEKFQEKLEENIIADDVEVALEDDWEGLAVWGEGCDGIINEMDRERFTIFPGHHSRLLNYDVLVKSGDWGRAKGILENADEVADMHEERIKSGIPAVGVDVGERDLPHEVGLGDLAVSYNKGCYLGQEVMSRLHSMGQVQRIMCRIEVSGDVRELPLEVIVEGKRWGEVRSVSGGMGLAMLKRRLVEGLGEDGVLETNGIRVKFLEKL